MVNGAFSLKSPKTNKYMKKGNGEQAPSKEKISGLINCEAGYFSNAVFKPGVPNGRKFRLLRNFLPLLSNPLRLFYWTLTVF